MKLHPWRDRRAITAAAVIAGAALLLSSSPARALEVTVELGDCRMLVAVLTTCQDGGSGIPDNQVVPVGEALWIDFTLGGEPMAHIVSHEIAIWTITFGYSGGADPNAMLVLTDMDGPIGDPIGLFPDAEEECDLFGLCVYVFMLPGETFIHDLHIEPVPQLTSLGVPGSTFDFLEFFTHGGKPHEKGLWVPEPSTALLLTPALLGLAGLAAARRRRLN